MAIEITGLSSSYTQTSSESSKVLVGRTEPTAAQKATGSPQTAETVTLSEFAQQLHGLKSSLGSVPVVDIQRIEQVKQSLINGSYDFNSDRVAAKYMQFETRRSR